MTDLRSPILPGKGATDYERYLRTDDLLTLQKPNDKLVHSDEMTFQIVHQSSELLLKGAGFDIGRVIAYLDAGDTANAARLLRRINMVLVHPIQLLRVLETLSPYDYHIIRAQLGHGSGLDSPGFLAMLHLGPRLGDAFFALQKKSGVALEEMYRRHSEPACFGLHEVAECLLDFDEQIQLFRFLHLKLAQRIIGPGVIGTSGVPVEILHKRMEHFFYKDLWDVRNEITARANTSPAPPTYGHGGK